MFPIVRSTSSTRFLHPILHPPPPAPSSFCTLLLLHFSLLLLFLPLLLLITSLLLFQACGSLDLSQVPEKRRSLECVLCGGAEILPAVHCQVKLLKLPGKATAMYRNCQVRTLLGRETENEWSSQVEKPIGTETFREKNFSNKKCETEMLPDTDSISF